MIRSITQKKPDEELEQLLNGFNRIFIIGCGTCTTLTRTGGEPEVRKFKQDLSDKGKMITGTTVVPVACDNLSSEFLSDFGEQINQADALLITSCAFGVQTIARQLKKMVVPALNTMFIGKETAYGSFDEVCTQCNGPCGGTNHGKCEIDVNKDCVWTLIYNRLSDLGRLESMRKYQKPRNHTGEPKPGKFKLPAT
jgi:hypothetical protein